MKGMSKMMLQQQEQVQKQMEIQMKMQQAMQQQTEQFMAEQTKMQQAMMKIMLQENGISSMDKASKDAGESEKLGGLSSGEPLPTTHKDVLKSTGKSTIIDGRIRKRMAIHGGDDDDNDGDDEETWCAITTQDKEIDSDDKQDWDKDFIIHFES